MFSEKSSHQMVLAFDHTFAQNIEISGGKGANLAKLSQTLPVPDGFIVSSLCYRNFIKPLRADIQSILQKTSSVQTQSEEIQALIMEQIFPQTLMHDLQHELKNLQQHEQKDRHEWLFAVRSSATMEDLPGAAFAGQHDTYLNCKGVDEIAQAILKCYASLWNEHAIHYRNRLHLDHIDAAMAIVIQKMVNVTAHEAAGVAFSIDPIQGDLTKVLINAAFGLGESVVDGAHAVDEYRVNFGEQTVVEKTLATKPTALISQTVTGTQEIHLSPEQAAMSSLTDAQCLQIAALAKQAEAFFGFPQDIEWAFSQNELYLLQSRPVTFVPERWTRDESAERFPNVVTPLTWDLVEEGFHTSLNHSFELMGLPHFGGKWFGMKDFYIYGNQNAVDLYSGRMPFKVQTLEDVRHALPILAQRFTWIQELPTLWMRDLDTYLLAIGSFMQEKIETYTLEEQWSYIKRIRDTGTQYFLPNIAISLTQRLLYTALYHLVSMTLPTLEAQKLYDQLLSACQTKTVEVNKDLWQLSRSIRHKPALLALLQQNSAHEVLTQLHDFPAFEQAFHLFLQRHGHRELDFDAYYPTWLEAPHTVIDQLRALSDLEDTLHNTPDWKGAMLAAEVRQRFVAQMPEDLRYLAEEVIRLARVYTQLDDLEHYQTTRLTLPFRKGLKAIGQRLVEKGVLQQHSDIYFIPFADLDQAVTSADFSRLKNIFVTHKTGWQQAKKATPAWNYGEDKVTPQVQQDGSLTGLSGSPGQTEGEVFLVHSPEEFNEFPQGAILVARTTSPAWTSLFYRAKGVITESGGPLSHGAVTARELGIPAVMSVHHAMDLLKNGMRVKLDGRQGTIHFI